MNQRQWLNLDIIWEWSLSEDEAILRFRAIYGVLKEYYIICSMYKRFNEFACRRPAPSAVIPTGQSTALIDSETVQDIAAGTSKSALERHRVSLPTYSKTKKRSADVQSASASLVRISELSKKTGAILARSSH